MNMRMRTRLLSLVLAAVLLLSAAPLPVLAESLSDYETIFSTYNTYAVQNDPPYDIVVTLEGADYQLRAVTTYHWNGGRGSAPGVIFLYEDDALLDSWPAASTTANDTEWVAYVDVTLRSGHSYYVTDSDPATMSWNEASDGGGFYTFYGERASTPSTPAPASNARDVTAMLYYRGIRLQVDGNVVVPCDVNGAVVDPFIIEGTTYLPLRAVSAALGCDVGWDGSTGTITLTSGASRVYNSGRMPSDRVGEELAVLSYRDLKLVIDGSRVVPKDVNGTVVDPFIIDGTTYMPVRALAGALGCGVDWVSATNTVVITSAGSPPAPSQTPAPTPAPVPSPEATETPGPVQTPPPPRSWDPGTERNNGGTLTVPVNPAYPAARFSNGVTVDFGETGLMAEEGMAVEDRGTSDPDGFAWHTYDFTLGGGGSVDLPVLTAVTVPTDPGRDPDDAVVEVYENGEWVPVFSETDENGNIVFYPEHFTPYRVGWLSWLLGSAAAKQQTMYYYANKTVTPLSRVSLNAVYLRERLADKALTAGLKAKSDAGKYVEAGWELFGYTGDGLGGYVAVQDLMGDSSVFSGLSDGMGNIGNVGTIVNIIYTSAKKGDVIGTLRDNWASLSKMAADYALKKAGTAAAATAANVLTVIYVCYEASAALNAKVDFAMKLGGSTEADYAFRRFTMDNVALNINTLQAASFYDPNGTGEPWRAELKMRDLGGEYYRIVPASTSWIESVTAIFKRSPGMQRSWHDLLAQIAASVPADRPAECLNRLNKAIDSYLNVFWSLDEATRRAYLNKTPCSTGTASLSSVWQEPTAQQKADYIAAMKAQIYAQNKDIFEPLMEKAYRQMCNFTFREAYTQCNLLNETVTLRLREASGKPISDTPYADADMRVVQEAFKGADDFRFTAGNGYAVTCTKYAWLLASGGKKTGTVRITMADGSQKSVSFTLNESGTEILLDSVRETVTLEDSEPRTGVRYGEEKTSYMKYEIVGGQGCARKGKYYSGVQVSAKPGETVTLNYEGRAVWDVATAYAVENGREPEFAYKGSFEKTASYRDRDGNTVQLVEEKEDIEAESTVSGALTVAVPADILEKLDPDRPLIIVRVYTSVEQFMDGKSNGDLYVSFTMAIEVNPNLA